MEASPGHFHREDYYLAQIACEIRRSFVKEPSKYHLKDFLLTFSPGESKSVSAAPSQTEPTSSLIQSKSAWGALVGLNLTT